MKKQKYGLKRWLGLVVSMRCAEAGPSTWLDRLGMFFNVARESLASIYVIGHDGGKVRAEKAIGASVPMWLLFR
eukprot:g15692.t1